jgi:uncharacterized protein YgbK (DUF1537 family)
LTAPRRLPLEETFQSLPTEWAEDPLPDIRSALRELDRKIVVLDDDPTGTQTVHDVPVLTDWSVNTLAGEMAKDIPAFYVLTNSRSMPLSQAREANAHIGRNLAEASRRAGKGFVVVSRSDSTLRGHFPGEVEAIVDGVGQDFDAWIFAPYFLEGGRYTINDVHYVAEGEWLTPAGDTEFARDSAFAFRSSNLRQWVEEKTQGCVAAESVASVSLEDIRQGGPSRVTERLMPLSNGAICFPNAVTMRDMEVFVLGLLEAQWQGKRFLFRTAASLIRALLGQSGRSLLTKEELGIGDSGGGLIVVGSHVPRTTSQLNHLLEHTGVAHVEVSASNLLSQASREAEIKRVARQVESSLQDGRDAVIFTSRQLVQGADAEGSLSIGQQVSSGLVETLKSISVKPRYVLTKGGITSSDIATQALGVKRAWAPGQILPGVPVWKLGQEARFPDMAYIIFPGNVGGPDALTSVVTKLGAS